MLLARSISASVAQLIANASHETMLEIRALPLDPVRIIEEPMAFVNRNDNLDQFGFVVLGNLDLLYEITPLALGTPKRTDPQ